MKILVFVLLLTAAPVFAQHAFYIGAFGGVNYNVENASGQTFSGAVPCVVIPGGNGFGPLAGLLVEFPLSDKFSLSMRGMYNDASGTLESSPTIAQFYDSLTNSYGNFNVQHQIIARLTYVSLQPEILYAPFAFPLSFTGGIEAGYAITKTYQQNENILTPNAVFYPSYQQQLVVRPAGSPITTASAMRLAIGVGAEYMLPLSRVLFMAPGINFEFPLLKVTSDASWSVMQLSGQIALKYSIERPKEVPPPPPPAPPPPLPPPPPVPVPLPPPPARIPMLASNVSAMAVDKNGNKDSVLHVTVEEYSSTQSIPLLTYIFFDKNSTTIPSRYVTRTPNETAQFNETKLPKDNLATYHNVLDITGSRLQHNTKASITLTGTTSGDDEGSSAALGKARAQAVKDYLVSTWSVAPNRITVNAQARPNNPTLADTEPGREENRRVEISSNDPSIIQPVVAEESEYTVDPPAIDFYPAVTAEDPVTEWDMDAKNNQRELFHESGAGAPPSPIPWKVADSKGGVPTEESSINYTLSLRDSAGQHAQSLTKSIPVTQRTLKFKRQNRIADTVYNTFGLTLFDYDKATITRQNERIIQSAIGDITPESHVSVLGYSDSLGNSLHNIQLADDRAKAAESIIKKYSSPATLREQGMGMQEITNASTPEGRFYSRTVQIQIATPVKQ